MQIFGTATLVIDKKQYETLVEIDTVNGAIKCYPKPPLHPLLIIALNNNEGLLKDFKADIINGRITKHEISNLLLVDWIEGKASGRLETEMKSIHGRNELYFNLSHSKLELGFTPTSPFSDKTELHYINYWLTSNIELNLETYKCNIKSDGHGHAFCFINKSLATSEFSLLEKIIATSCSLSQSIFPDCQEVMLSDKLIINLKGYKKKLKHYRFITDSNTQTLFSAVSNTLFNLNPNEINQFYNTIYYFNNGLNNDIHLEHRCFSIFTAYEMIDKCKRLNKNSLKDQLHLESLYDASFIINLRNEMIHYGLSIEKSIEKISSEIKERDKDCSELEKLFSLNETKKKQVVVYFFMVDKLYRYLIKRINYTGHVKYKCLTYLNTR